MRTYQVTKTEPSIWGKITADPGLQVFSGHLKADSERSERLGLISGNSGIQGLCGSWSSSFLWSPNLMNPKNVWYPDHMNPRKVWSPNPMNPWNCDPQTVWTPNSVAPKLYKPLFVHLKLYEPHRYHHHHPPPPPPPPPPEQHYHMTHKYAREGNHKDQKTKKIQLNYHHQQ